MTSWHCPRCGRSWEAPDHVTAHFHPCTPGRRTRRWAPPDLEGTTTEEAWARAFSGFAGGYQPPTPEEALAETGESGRRKEGTGRRTTPAPNDPPAPVDGPWSPTGFARKC